MLSEDAELADEDELGGGLGELPLPEESAKSEDWATELGDDVEESDDELDRTLLDDGGVTNLAALSAEF
jgi:hypothetical protein